MWTISNGGVPKAKPKLLSDYKKRGFVVRGYQGPISLTVSTITGTCSDTGQSENTGAINAFRSGYLYIVTENASGLVKTILQGTVSYLIS